MKPYSLAFCRKIIKAYEDEAISQRKLANRLSIAPSFIQKLIEQYRETDLVVPKVRTQQTTPKLNNEHLATLHRLVEERNDATLKELRDLLADEAGVDVSRSIIDRALAKIGLTLRKNVPC